MSVVVYDLETTGVDSSADRITQFGGIRVSDDLKDVLAEEQFLVRLEPHIVPDPKAMLVSRLMPSQLVGDGIPEHEAAKRIESFLGKSGTLRTGANTLAFDDEFVRNLFWRNLRDPYRTEWDGGNRRMDVQALLRAASILSPSLMAKWPVDEEGEPTYRLGHTMAAMGIEFDGRAHDAVADAKGTLEVLRRIKEKTPEIFDLGVRCANKRRVSFTKRQGTSL